MAAANLPGNGAAMGQLVQVSHSSHDAEILCRHLSESFLDRGYSSQLTITSIHKIVNTELERQYLEKKTEMHAMGRTNEEVKEIFGFTVAKKSMSYLKKIVNDGLITQRTDYNAFGDSAKGVYISRHCDVMLKFAEIHKTKFLRIIVHKLIPGKLLATEQGPAVQPTPGYDGHVSPKKPEVTKSLELQVMLSQLYIYELDKQDNPLPHPRQSLPYAVFTFEPINIPRTLPSQPQQPSQTTSTTSTTSVATSQEQFSLATNTLVQQNPKTKLITVTPRNQQTTQAPQTQAHVPVPATAATSLLTTGRSTTFAPRTPNSPFSQAQFSGMSGMTTFSVPTSSGTSVQQQRPQVVRILRADSSTIRQIMAQQAHLQAGQRTVIVPMVPGKPTSLLSPRSGVPQATARKSTPTRGRGRGQTRGRGANSALGRVSVAGPVTQQTASSTMAYQYTIPPSGSVVLPSGMSFSTVTNLNQGLQSGNTDQTLFSSVPVGSTTSANQVVQPQSPLQNLHVSYAHGSVSSMQNMSVSQGSFTGSPNISAVTTLSSGTLVNDCPISTDPDLGSVTPIEIAPIEGYGEIPQTTPNLDYGETPQTTPIEGYGETNVPTVEVKQEKSRSTGHNRQRTTSIIDLISDEEAVPEFHDQQGDSPGRPSSVETVPTPQSQHDQPYSQQGQPQGVREQHELPQQNGIQDAQNDVTSQSNPNPVEPVTIAPSVKDLNGTCDSEATVAYDDSAQDSGSRTGEPEPKMVQHEFVKTNEDGTIEVVKEMVLESELLKRQAESSRLTSAHNWDLDSMDEDDEGGDTSLDLMSPDRTHGNDEFDLTETRNSEQKSADVQSPEKPAEKLSETSVSVQLETLATPSVSCPSTLPVADLSAKKATSDRRTINISSGVESESGRESPQLGLVISSITSAADAGSSVDSVNVKEEKSHTETESRSLSTKSVEISGSFIPTNGILTDTPPDFDMSCLPAVTSDFADDASDMTLPDESLILDESNNMSNARSTTPQEEMQQPTRTVGSTAAKKNRKNSGSLPKKKQKVPRQAKPDKMVHGKVRKINLEEILSRVYSAVDSPSTSSMSSSRVVLPEPDYQSSEPTDDDMNSDTMSLGELRPHVSTKTFGPLECREAENDPVYQPYIKLIDVKNHIEEPTPSSPVHYSDIDYDVPKPKKRMKKKASLPQWNTRPIPQWSPNKRKLLTARKSVTKGSLKPAKPVTLSHPRFATSAMSKSLSFTTTTLLGSMGSLCGESTEEPSTSSLDKAPKGIPEKSKPDSLSPVIPLVDVLKDTSRPCTPNANEEKMSNQSEEFCETTPDPAEQNLTTPTSDEKVAAGLVQSEPSSEGTLNTSAEKLAKGKRTKGRPAKFTKRRGKAKVKPKPKPKQDIYDNSSSGNESNPRRRKSATEKEKIIPVRRGRSLKALLRVDYAEEPDEPEPVYMAQLKNTESEFKRLVQIAAQEAIAEKSGIEIPLGANIDIPATRAKVTPPAKGKGKGKKGKSSQVEPFFDPKIPLIRDDPTYVERTMYKPEIPGILDDNSESKSAPSKEAPQPETTASTEKKAETKDSKSGADPVTLGSEDDEMFLALLKSRLRKAKTVEEAEKLKNLIAEYCPAAATKPQETKDGSSQSTSATEQNKDGQTKPDMKINLDDYDYGDEEESAKAVVPATPKQETEVVEPPPAELEDEDLTLDTLGFGHTDHHPDEALVGLQDERWKILQELEECEEPVDAESKDDKPSDKSTGTKKKFHKRKRKRRSGDKEQNEETSDAGVANEECPSTSANQEKEDSHTKMHHDRKGKSGRKRILSTESGSNSDEEQMKSRPGGSEKSRDKKYSNKDKKRKSVGSEVGDESKVKVSPKKTLYTDSEVIRNMMCPKAGNKKEVRANLFDGYGSETANPLNVSSDPDQWMQKLQQINQTTLNPDETNVMDQILASTDVQGTSTDDTAGTIKDQGKDGAEGLVKVQENAVNQGTESPQVSSKPMEKEKPAKVKLKLDAYLARNTDKEKKTPHLPDKKPIKDVTASLLTETSSELQLNVTRTTESKIPHVSEGKPIKDVTALLLTDTSNELQLNIGHRIDSAVKKEEPVKILEFEDIKRILDTVKMNEAAAQKEKPPEEKKPVIPIPNDPRITLGARGVKPLKETKPQRKLISTAQEPDDEIPPARRLNYLQHNMEQIQIKRKELVQELNCLKKKVDTPEGRNPRLRQEIQILDHFIRGLYIDEEIIKKEMDNIRGTVKAQVNQAVPIELLLPEEAAQQQTADDVPLFLMNKLLDEQYGHLLSLKFDHIATSAEWKKTNVLDSEKKRALQKNFTFIKETRRKQIAMLCKSKDFRSKLKEYSEKMAWYQKHHEQFLRDYTRTPNPCTEARIRHIDIRIAELHMHVKHLRKVMGLPPESTKGVWPGGARHEAVKAEAAESKPGPTPQVDQKPKETDIPALSPNGEIINPSAETSACHSTGSASQHTPPSAFLRGDAITNKEMPLSFPKGEMPPWLRKKEGSEKKEEVQADKKEEEIPPWLRKRKNVEEAAKATPPVDQNKAYTSQVEESATLSKRGSSLTGVPPEEIIRKIPERRSSIESSILREIQGEAVQLRMSEEQRSKDVAAARSQSDMDLCSDIDLDISLDVSLSDIPNAGQNLSVVRDTYERDLRNELTVLRDTDERDLRNQLTVSRDASERDLRNESSMLTPEHSVVVSGAANPIPVLVTSPEKSETVLKLQSAFEVSNIPVIVNVSRTSQREMAAKEDIMVPDIGQSTQSKAAEPAIPSKNASQSKISKTHESDKGTSDSDQRKIDHRRRSSIETKVRTGDKGHSESRSSTSSRSSSSSQSSSSRSESSDRKRSTMKHSDSTEHKTHRSRGSKSQREEHKTHRSTGSKSQREEHKIHHSESHKRASSTKPDHKRRSSTEAKSCDSGKSHSRRSPSEKDTPDSKSCDQNRSKTKRSGSVDHTNDTTKGSLKSVIGKPSSHGVESKSYIRTENKESDTSQIPSVGSNSRTSTPTIVDLTSDDSPEKAVNNPERMEESPQSPATSNHECLTSKDDFSIVSEEEDLLDTSGTLHIVIPDDSPIPKLIPLEQNKPGLNEKTSDIANMGAQGDNNSSPCSIDPTKQVENQMRIGASGDCEVSTVSAPVVADSESVTKQQEETGPHISNEISRPSLATSPFDDDIVITRTMQLTREQLLKQVLQRKTTLSQKLALNEQLVKKENADTGRMSKDTVTADDEGDDDYTLVIDEDRVPVPQEESVVLTTPVTELPFESAEIEKSVDTSNATPYISKSVNDESSKTTEMKDSVEGGIDTETVAVDDDHEIIALTNEGHDATPIMDEGRETTPLRVGQREATAIRDEGYETTPLRVGQREATAIRDEGCETTPLRVGQREATAIRDEGCETALIGDGECETTLLMDEEGETMAIKDGQCETTPLMDEGPKTTTIADETHNSTKMTAVTVIVPRVLTLKKSLNKVRRRSKWDQKTKVPTNEAHITTMTEDPVAKRPKITNVYNSADEVHDSIKLKDPAGETQVAVEIEDLSNEAEETTRIKKSMDEASKTSTVKSPIDRAHRSPKKESRHRTSGSHRSTKSKDPSRKHKHSKIGIKRTSSKEIGKQETDDEVLISSPSRPSKTAKTDGESKLTKRITQPEKKMDTPKSKSAQIKKAAAQADALIAFVKQDIAAKEQPVERQLSQEDSEDSLSSNDPNETVQELSKKVSGPSLEVSVGGNDTEYCEKKRSQYHNMDSVSRRQAYKQKGKSNSALSTESGSTDKTGNAWKNFPQRYKQPAWSSDRSWETDESCAKTGKASMERSPPSSPTREEREGSYHSRSHSPYNHHSKSPPRTSTSLKRKREETFAADNEWEHDTSQQAYRDRREHKKHSPSTRERSSWRRKPHQLSTDRGVSRDESPVTRNAREGRGRETCDENVWTREDRDRIPRRRASPGGTWTRDSRTRGSWRRESRYRSPERSPSPESISWSRNVRAATEARRSPGRRIVHDRSPRRRDSQERSPIREMREGSYSSQFSHHSRSVSPYSRASASPTRIRSPSPSPQSRRKSPSPSSWEYHQSHNVNNNNPRGTAYTESEDTRAVPFSNPIYGHGTGHQFHETLFAQHNFRGRGRGGRGANRQRMHYRDLREHLEGSHQVHYTDNTEPVRPAPPYPILDDQQQWQHASQTHTNSHWQLHW